MDSEKTLEEPQVTSDPEDTDVTDPDPSQDDLQPQPGDALDPEKVDDRGVSWKNVAAENERKRIQAEERNKAYEETLRQIQYSQQAGTQPQKQKTEDRFAKYNNMPNPAEFAKQLVEDITSEMEVQQYSRVKNESERRAYTNYPDLKNPNSELRKRVAEEADYLRSMGLEPTEAPRGLEMITERVAKNLQKKSNENNNPLGTPLSTPQIGTTSSPSLSKKKDLPPLSDMQKDFLKRTGKNEEDRKWIENDLRKKMQSGRFNLQ